MSFINIEELNLFDITDKNMCKSRIEHLLSLYRRLNFFTSNNIDILKNNFVQINDDQIKNIVRDILNVDLKYYENNIKFERKNLKETAIFITIMDLTIDRLEKYPDNGEIYAKILKIKYFDEKKYSNEIISEEICMSRSSFYRYLRHGTLIFGNILFNIVLPEINETKKELN
ncbi:hypothetical protein [Anaerosphaera multitolerans]|uniref:DUF1492 domain-containing protein n=1 Tax=Anaerosphaera multitolerans TaxID=2487351 RepID=A0A437S9B0_9FIRM|nr:hypothetical protein [Anaerosphaera multitolerans]RVU55444.1 hypothetical protein EF514_01565 [Anaerosphaera multitolerans]